MLTITCDKLIALFTNASGQVDAKNKYNIRYYYLKSQLVLLYVANYKAFCFKQSSRLLGVYSDVYETWCD